jgi:hypothetical protein
MFYAPTAKTWKVCLVGDILRTSPFLTILIISIWGKDLLCR